MRKAFLQALILLPELVCPGWEQVNPGNYPPGTYPPGNYPPGQSPGGGIGIPRIGHKSDKNKQSKNGVPEFVQDAVVISNDGKQLVLKTDDGRSLAIAATPQTVWQKEGKPATSTDVRPEMVVHLEAIEDGEAFLTAATVNVTAEKQLIRRKPSDDPAPKPQVPASQEATTEKNSKPPDPEKMGAPPDDPDRPVLRRGQPSGEHAGSSDIGAAAVPVSRRIPPLAAAKKPADPNAVTEFSIEDSSPAQPMSAGVPTLVAQTMDWVTTFANGLPNFVCQQLTTRYAEQSKGEGFQPIDIITAKVVYENGGERYQDITLGGKRTTKSMLDLGGATSTGEFAATLRDLFWPGTRAQFKLNRSGMIAYTPVAVFDFTVDLDHSHWTIKIGSQTLRPAFSGQVWIDKTTGEVRKIETQADDLPKNFPLRNVFSSVAYDPVRLGTASFLLPVVAVNQSCERKSSVCTKNDVEWRDYHKYSGESTITYH